ncbi:MAG: efflux RND transporter periplasmic adaptor subunit [Armatimonadetes bacterium]|nr:efflux RND transporter periplasmic adaptor subunit [Armatimonadota bacterium]
MSPTLNFIKKHWLTLGLLVGSVVGVSWIVTHNRPPGSMTVIEAQGMDMTTMKPPVGVMPVSLETVRWMSLNGGSSFPATISAFTDEEVTARIPGRISRILVYPGDQVAAGQLLATLDAPEYDAQLRKAQATSGAKAAEVVSAERMIAHHKNILAGSKASVNAAQAARDKAQTDVEAADIELQKSKDELAGAKAAKEERLAEVTYADKELVREKQLYSKGAISLDELQTSQRDRDAAAARVQSAEAAVQSSNQSVRIADKRLTAARQTVVQADAQIAAANADAAQAQEGIAQAHADANAKRFESSAASAEAAGASVFVDYRKLTALASGVVAERVVSPGTAVAAGQVVLRLKSVGQVRVQADVPQAFAASVRAGTAVRIVTDSTERKAHISSVFPSVDPQTRTFRVEALVSDSSGSLKPGMFARLELEGSGVRGLAVRSAAVQSDDNGKFVWLAVQRKGTGKTDWTCTMHPQVSRPGPGKCPICGMDLVPREKGGPLVAHRQPVTVSKEAGDYTVIVTGLKDGDKIVWKGFESLIEGTSIQDSSQALTPTPPSGEQVPGMDMPSEGGASRATQPAQGPATQQPATSDYTCPMHTGVSCDRPGKCPKCGMDLVKRDTPK